MVLLLVLLQKAAKFQKDFMFLSAKLSLLWQWVVDEFRDRKGDFNAWVDSGYMYLESFFPSFKATLT